MSASHSWQKAKNIGYSQDKIKSCKEKLEPVQQADYEERCTTLVIHQQ